MLIPFTKRNFSDSPNGKSNLPFTMKALLRAVIAAGRKPARVKRTIAGQSDIDMRISALKSAVEVRGSTLAPTPEYRAAGSTDRAHKSFYVANALCAHAAYKDLTVPWLVDLERLGSHYRVDMRRKNSKQRPDFVGKDTGARWFAFECKGRASSPGPASLRTWKQQARAVRQVNGRQVVQGIVSAAYINNASSWELLWVDPPTAEDGEDLIFDDFAFFDAYYRPILEFIERDAPSIETPTGILKLSRDGSVYVGLHRSVLAAVRERDEPALLSFAARMNTNENTESDGSSIFRDGLIVRLGPEWESGIGNRITQPSAGAVAESQQRLASVIMAPVIVGQPERATQNRVIALFRDELHYRYLGDWIDREGNSNIEEEILKTYLTNHGYTSTQISMAIHKLRTEADNHNRNLYGNNQAVYNLLRYGVPVKTEAGKVTETVHVINWNEPEENDFAIAEEVTLRGNHERRPDLVLYVNGIAVGILELKNSRISIGDGIRQCLSNQQPEFNRDSSAQCSSSLPATTPRVCNTAPWGRRKNTS